MLRLSDCLIHGSEEEEALLQSRSGAVQKGCFGIFRFARYKVQHYCTKCNLVAQKPLRKQVNRVARP